MKLIDNIITWIDDRSGLKAPIVAMATHLVPPGAKWYYVFGTAIMTSLIVQIVSGIALSTVYVPSAGQAYESVKYITTQAPFGNLLRGMHYFGASSMILFTGFHMLRVYLTASYKFPRELNWLSGVALLFITVGMGFTGQVLRWDQTAIWTVAVGAEQALRMPFLGKLLVQVFLSGGSVGSATLSHFFALHVFIFPGLLFAMLGLHLYLVLHNGISEPPVEGEPVDPQTYKAKYHQMLILKGKPFWPDAAWRDIVFSTLVVIGILALSICVGPPHMEKPPDPSIIEAQPKPDWYLLWYFALLALLPHKAEDWVIILLPLFIIATLFALPFFSNKGERSIKRRPWAVAIVVFVLTSVAALWRAGSTEPWTPMFKAHALNEQVVGASSGPVFDGAEVFDTRGCLFCHAIEGQGGKRGPDLTHIASRLTKDQLIIRVMNGGYNMPAYAGNMTPKELEDLTAFLMTRK